MSPHMPSGWRHWSSALVLQAIGLSLVDRAGLAVFDVYQRAAPRAYEDAPVRIVDIDDETIRRLGQWPWPRDQVALLTRKLTEAGAAVVAYDIVFSEPDRTAPARLAARLRASGDLQAAAVLARLPDPDTTFAQTTRRDADRARLFPDARRPARGGATQGGDRGRRIAARQRADVR